MVFGERRLYKSVTAGMKYWALLEFEYEMFPINSRVEGFGSTVGTMWGSSGDSGTWNKLEEVGPWRHVLKGGTFPWPFFFLCLCFDLHHFNSSSSASLP